MTFSYLLASNEFVQDYSIRPNVLANTGMTSEQASKLDLGKCKSVTCLYDKHQIIHFIKDPIIITLIASDDCNTGLLLGLETQFEPILQSLSKIVSINIVSPIYGKE
jgi:PREDICTED: similar to mitogen-activated protein kinase 1 interacting protein 1